MISLIYTWSKELFFVVFLRNLAPVHLIMVYLLSSLYAFDLLNIPVHNSLFLLQRRVVYALPGVTSSTWLSMFGWVYHVQCGSLKICCWFPPPPLPPLSLSLSLPVKQLGNWLSYLVYVAGLAFWHWPTSRMSYSRTTRTVVSTKTGPGGVRTETRTTYGPGGTRTETHTFGGSGGGSNFSNNFGNDFGNDFGSMNIGGGRRVVTVNRPESKGSRYGSGWGAKPARKPAGPPMKLEGTTFAEIKAQCQREGRLFEDPDFPANDSSLYYSRGPARSIEWKRPTVGIAGSFKSYVCIGWRHYWFYNICIMYKLFITLTFTWQHKLHELSVIMAVHIPWTLTLHDSAYI